MVSEVTLVRIQSGSGLMFGSFLGLHLLNHSFCHFGMLASNSFMTGARLYYQKTPVELVCVFGAVTVHSAVGLLRIWRRQKRKKRFEQKFYSELLKKSKNNSNLINPTLELSLHRVAGLVLLLFVGGHIYVTRINPTYFHYVPDYGFPGFSLETWPVLFYPYYIIFGASGAYHFSVGVAKSIPIVKRMFSGLFQRFQKNKSIEKFDDTVPSSSSRSISRAAKVGIVFSLIIASSIFAIGGIYYPIEIEDRDLIIKVQERIIPKIFQTWRK